MHIDSKDRLKILAAQLFHLLARLALEARALVQKSSALSLEGLDEQKVGRKRDEQNVRRTRKPAQLELKVRI